MTSKPQQSPRPEHRGPAQPWPDAEYDAALHLLDRQIVDSHGLLVGKVDDVELTEDPDGALVPTGLLVGMAALLPRMGDRTGDWLFARYVRLATSFAERAHPGVVDLQLVEDLTSEVHLSVERDGLLHRRAEGEPGSPQRRTLGELLRMRVVVEPVPGEPRQPPLRVLDARLSPGRPGRVAALVVGRGRPGSMLGYDRTAERGPWLVAHTIRWLHRHSRLVRIGPDVDLDWGVREVRVGPGAETSPLPD